MSGGIAPATVRFQRRGRDRSKPGFLFPAQMLAQRREVGRAEYGDAGHERRFSRACCRQVEFGRIERIERVVAVAQRHAGRRTVLRLSS